MIKEFIGTGKTLDEATASAKMGLNAPATADVKIEVIQMPEKKKFFGLFGGADAQVKVSYDDGKRERKPQQKKKSQQRSLDSTEKKTQKKPAAATEKKQDKPEKKYREPRHYEKEAVRPHKDVEPISEDEIDLNAACDYLRNILTGLKIENPQLNARIEDNVVNIDIVCDDYGIIIGRRGETLDAIQYLTGLSIKNVVNKYVRVSLNVGDYREKRAETLTALAIKNANYVLRSGRRYIFEPMNPYERRIIHTAVQEIDGVSSRSVGTGTDRKVLIELEGGERQDRDYSHRRSGYGSRRPKYQPAQADPNRERRVDRADIPKFGKIEVNNQD